ncbi:MAG TPA: radical SAM family heme chaperone HemW [Terriglobia bacterium]|nr:radical SAM family heme chaperone HemW [Terriglobia bacterium]
MSAVPTNEMLTLGVYIQVPFCASKCSFCNFSSRVERRSIFDHYTRNLQRELEGWQDFSAAYGVPPDVVSHPVDSIYIGGGTPTLLGEERLDIVVRGLQDHLRWSEEIEFTLETTPGSADSSLLRALRGLGVNRLSIGAQTFNDRELRAVGRLHSADDSSALVHEARHAGFQNISLDLIAGLPYQTEESFRRSLEATVKLRPEHVSLYLFEVDEKSRLGREVVHGGNRYHAAAVSGDDFLADAYESGCAFLASEGYSQYEISNFALPGFESRHNRKYWQLAPYLGLGAGAHSFDGVRRWSNQIDAQRYLAKLDAGQPPIDEFRILTVEEQVEEFFFLGLRQVEGVDLKFARERWGASDLKRWEEKIADLTREGWVVRQGERVRLARHAYLISNEIFQEFVCA